MDQAFLTKLETLGLTPTRDMLGKLDRYYEYLISENEMMNLTAITAKAEVYAKHFYDSLALIKAKDISDKTLLDVGSGAGFPSLPLKIFIPGLKVTIIDALKKRIDFLERLTKIIAIDDVELLPIRAEEYKQREAFDIVTARAVAKLNELSELCLPFVRIGGRFIAMKASSYHEELDEALKAIATLGGTLENIIEYNVAPGLERVLIIIRKTDHTPAKYPRQYAKIKHSPL